MYKTSLKNNLPRRLYISSINTEYQQHDAGESRGNHVVLESFQNVVENEKALSEISWFSLSSGILDTHCNFEALT